MNLKGGVGKTTLATNLAAFFSLNGISTLLIDMDFQGSASSAMLNITDNVVDLHSTIDNLFLAADAKPHPGDVFMSLGVEKLPKLHLAPSTINLASIENRRLVAWLMQEPSTDPRFALARMLFSSSVRTRFRVVIIDAPPRLSMGAINALTASRYLIVPTMPDRLSTSAASNFIPSVQRLIKVHNPALANLLVVLNGAPGVELAEADPTEAILQETLRSWDGVARFARTTVPRRAHFANALANNSLAILESDAVTPKTRDVLKSLGAEVADAINLA